MIEPLEKKHLYESKKVLQEVSNIAQGRNWKNLTTEERERIANLFGSYDLYLALFHFGYGFRKIENRGKVMIKNGLFGHLDQRLHEKVKGNFDHSRTTLIMWKCFVHDIKKYAGHDPQEFLQLVRKSAGKELFGQAKRVKEKEKMSLEVLAEQQGHDVPDNGSLADFQEIEERESIKSILNLLQKKIRVQVRKKEYFTFLLDYLGRIVINGKDFKKEKLAKTMYERFGGTTFAHLSFFNYFQKRARKLKNMIEEQLHV